MGPVRSVRTAVLLLIVLTVLVAAPFGLKRAPASSTPAAEEPPGRGIAFLLQLTNETLPGAERLLRALWHPDNAFAVHVDAKWAATPEAQALRELVRRPPYADSVIVMRPRRLTYAGISLSLNVLDAIDALLAMPGRRWSHFIPLSGADYPLLPPAEMQDVLAAAAKRAERDLSFVEAWRGNGTQRWRRPALDPALWNAEGPLAVIDYPWTWVRPSRPVPHGPAWVVLSRRACEAALQGPGMRRVLATLGGVEAPDESLWQMFFLWTEEGRRMQGTLAGDCLRYDEPTDGESHVKWLRTEGQLEAALASGALFARKLEPGSALIDMIDGMSEERRSKVRRAVDGRVGRAVDWLPGARAGK